MLNDLLFLISGIISGSAISWFIMKQKASVYSESTNRQITRFEEEATLMKNNIADKEKHINTLTASVSERDADIRNLREKLYEQKEDLEKMNERLKTEFKNLANEILDEKTESSWHREYNNGNDTEIAALGGELYDEFIKFSERFLKLGEKLDEAREDFDYTLNKLKTGKGNLVSRAEKLKNLSILTKPFPEPPGNSPYGDHLKTETG